MKKSILFFTIFILTSSFSYRSFAGNFNAIKNHDYLLLLDKDSKEILLSKNSHTRMAPSSMTKLMTAYVVFDQIKQGNVKMENYCVIGKDAWRKRGSTMFLNYGDIVSIQDLLTGLLTVSGNDASIALAQTVGKNYNNFISLMNLKAKELGMNDSKFKNPHGLNQNGHYMSLSDLAILLSSFYEDFPEYTSYLGRKKFTYGKITQYNSNPLIKTKYRGVIAGKTGHTNDGGYGVTASVTRGNRTLIGIVNKVRTPRQRTKLITQLFDFGFDEFQQIALFKKDQEIAMVKTWTGEKKFVPVSSNKDIVFNIPKNLDINSIKVSVIYDGPVQTPIQEGKKIANLKVRIKGYKTLNYSLFATQDVKKAKFFTLVSEKLYYQTKLILSKIIGKVNQFAFFQLNNTKTPKASS